MPLFVPASGDVFLGGGRSTSSIGTLRNNGADTAITFSGAMFHPIRGDLIIAGDNDYVGTMATALAKLQQIATLPVAATSPCRGLAMNWLDNGVLYWGSGNDYFRAPSDMSVWTQINAGLVGTRGPIFSINGNPLLFAYDGSTGARSLSTSNDNGVTWNPGAVNLAALMGGTSSANGLCIVSPDGSVVLMAGDSNTVISSQVPEDNTQYEQFVMVGSGGNIGTGAISSDNQRAVVASNQGTIMVIDGGLSAGNESTLGLDVNFFRQTAANGITPGCIVYSEKLSGFFVFASSQNFFGFIPDDSMETMLYGQVIGAGTIPSIFSSNMGQSAVDINGDFIIPCNNNLSLLNVS